MLEFVITRVVLFAGAFLAFTAVEYYVEKIPLKESIEGGLFTGIFLTAVLTVSEFCK